MAGIYYEGLDVFIVHAASHASCHGEMKNGSDIFGTKISLAGLLMTKHLFPREGQLRSHSAYHVEFLMSCVLCVSPHHTKCLKQDHEDLLLLI